MDAVPIADYGCHRDHHAAPLSTKAVAAGNEIIYNEVSDQGGRQIKHVNQLSLIEMTQFRRRLRRLLDGAQAGNHPCTKDELIHVLLQERDRLEKTEPADSQIAQSDDEEPAEKPDDDDIDSSENADERASSVQTESICPNQDFAEVAETLRKAERVIVFVGAGISTNCGIPVCVALCTAINRHWSYSGSGLSFFQRSSQDQSRAIRHFRAW